MVQILYTILRSVFAYALLMILTRLMGRKIISQMTFFDFAVAITIGTVAGSLSIGPSINYVAGTTALITLALMAILTAYMHIKSFSFRKLVNSEPLVVIENGNIVSENLEKERYTINDLMMKLRKQSVFNVADVEFAIIETDGEMSVLLKSQKQALTPSDINLSTPYKGLTKDIIIDGVIMDENLQDINLDRNWLIAELKKKGIDDPSTVFYGGLDTAGNLYVSERKTGEEVEGQHGIE